ncbi:MAG TPA: alkaline phosphatase D family protein [Candidatus Deferrimicrobiaceae bacterium]|nr:alkaline phosphatase D family protein [Candidatus Deferrimicrobiaceae bacterium]
MRGAAVLIRLAWVVAAATAAPAAAAPPGLLVTVGEVTDTAAVVWVRGVTWGEVTVRYEPVARPAPAAGAAAGARGAIRVSPSRHLTGKLVLQPLEPATRYRYVVAQHQDEIAGEFVTAPAPAAAAPVRFAWSGDLGSRGHCRPPGDGFAIFRALAEVPADFFLFVGDTIYADHVCGEAAHAPGYDFVARRLADFWAKHRYNREDPAVQAYFRRASVYAIWDDHEVRNNFAGPTEPLMEPGRRAFIDYFPIRPPRGEPGRLYRKFRWGALLEVFILDTRQYRSPNPAPDGPGKTMLGAAQRRWLIDSLTASTAVWKVVVSSVPLSVPTGGRAHDSWSNAGAQGVPEEHGTGFAVERDTILRTLRQRGLKNLVFLAADVHHAELIRHHPTPEWSFHEFIAGPLSASTGQPRPLDTRLNPRSLWGLGGTANFGDIAIDASGLTVRIADALGDVRFTHTIGAE